MKFSVPGASPSATTIATDSNVTHGKSCGRALTWTMLVAFRRAQLRRSRRSRSLGLIEHDDVRAGQFVPAESAS